MEKLENFVFPIQKILKSNCSDQRIRTQIKLSKSKELVGLVEEAVLYHNGDGSSR